MNKFLIMVLTISMLCSCQSSQKIHVGDFGVISAKGMETSQITHHPLKLTAKSVEATFWAENKQDLENGAQKALEKAINNVGGDIMMNCQLFFVTEDGKQGYMIIGDVFEFENKDK